MIYLREFLSDYLKDISHVARCLYSRGWAEANAGNISVRLSQKEHISNYIGVSQEIPLETPLDILKEEWFLVTSTGSRMRDIEHDPEKGVCLVNILEDGSGIRVFQLAEGEPCQLPSSELPSHLAIHQMLRKKNRPEKSVIHTHCTELIALNHIKDLLDEESINRLLYSMHPEIQILLPDKIGFIPFTMPGTFEIAEKTVKKFESHRIVLWEKHGCLAIGENIPAAFDLIEIVAKSAKIFFTLKNSGVEPEGLTKSQLEKLKKG